MDGHQHEELSDEALAREIEAALGVDPSPEFLPRIRARIASGRVSESWLWPRMWRWASAVVAVAAVVVVGLEISNGPSDPGEEHIVNAPLVERPPTPDTVASSTETRKPEIAAEIRTVRSMQRPPVEAKPEIVVSPGDAVALRRLVVAIAARQVKAVDVPTLGAEAAPLAPIEQIVPIEEMVLEPIKLSPMAALEGE